MPKKNRRYDVQDGPSVAQRVQAYGHRPGPNDESLLLAHLRPLEGHAKGASGATLSMADHNNKHVHSDAARTAT